MGTDFQKFPSAELIASDGLLTISAQLLHQLDLLAVFGEVGLLLADEQCIELFALGCPVFKILDEADNDTDHPLEGLVGTFDRTVHHRLQFAVTRRGKRLEVAGEGLVGLLDQRVKVLSVLRQQLLKLGCSCGDCLLLGPLLGAQALDQFIKG